MYQKSAQVGAPRPTTSTGQVPARAAAGAVPRALRPVDVPALQRAVGNMGVVWAVQRLEITTKNRKEVEALHRRYVDASGGEKGWKELLAGARSLALLTTAVAKLEEPEEDADDDGGVKIDKHGGKHLRKPKTGGVRAMKAKSKTQPATFFPTVDYADVLRRAVLISERTGSQFVEVGSDVGVDKGEVTSIVEIYGGAEIGYHIRPKNSTYIKGLRSRDIPSLVAEERTGEQRKQEGKEEGKEEGESGTKATPRGKRAGGVPEEIPGAGRVENVSGHGMNCLIRALYRAAGMPDPDGAQVNLIRWHLHAQNVADRADMLDLAGAAGGVLITYLVAQQVIPAARGVVLYTPERLAVPLVIVAGGNPIRLWLSTNHFRAVV